MPFDHDDLQDNEYPAPSAYNHRRYNYNRSLCWQDIKAWAMVIAVVLMIAYIAFLAISYFCNKTMY